jgi:hypothetical protein
MFAAANDESTRKPWRSVLFPEGDGTTVIGQRLGVPYLRTLEATMEMSIGPSMSLTLHQCSLGLTAISGVVWDCGLLLVDYLVWETERFNTVVSSGKKNDHQKNGLENVLDLGTGTGICGIAAILLGASRVVFTDIHEPPSFEDNLYQLTVDQRKRASFVAYDWSIELVDKAIVSPLPTSIDTTDDIQITTKSNTLTWDTVLCSDLLYDQKNHEPLLRVLRTIHFKRAIFAYKKRHDVPESVFFLQLETFCHLHVIQPEEFPLHNLLISSIPGLFIIIATSHHAS